MESGFGMRVRVCNCFLVLTWELGGRPALDYFEHTEAYCMTPSRAAGAAKSWLRPGRPLCRPTGNIVPYRHRGQVQAGVGWGMRAMHLSRVFADCSAAFPVV